MKKGGRKADWAKKGLASVAAAEQARTTAMAAPPAPAENRRRSAAAARNVSIGRRQEREGQDRIARMEERLATGTGRNTGRVRRQLEAERPAPKSEPSFAERVEARVAAPAAPTTTGRELPPSIAPNYYKDAGEVMRPTAPRPMSPESVAPPTREELPAVKGSREIPAAPVPYREGYEVLPDIKTEGAPKAIPRAEAPDPEEMRKLYKVATGSDFVENSRAAQARMRDLQDFYTTSGGMSGRTPTRFALDYYKTLK